MKKIWSYSRNGERMDFMSTAVIKVRTFQLEPIVWNTIAVPIIPIPLMTLR